MFHVVAPVAWKNPLWRTIISLLIVALLAVLPTPISAQPPEPTLLRVSTTSDVLDGNTSSALSLNSNPGNDGRISLREAITAANATSGDDPIQITFSLDERDPSYTAATGWVIRVTAGKLPFLLHANLTIEGPGPDAPAVIIDGGYVPGVSTGIGDGLRIAGPGIVVRNLTVQRFSARGIILQGSARQSVIEDCIIQQNGETGVLLFGATVLENRILKSTIVQNGTGVRLSRAAQNSIGGASPEQGNRIADNTLVGVEVDDQASGNEIGNNWIGLDASGTGAAPNGLAGIRLTQSNRHVIANNVISGNGTGVLLSGSSSNTLRGNTIGLSADGQQVVPNQGNGVQLSAGAQNNQIGGSDAAARNVISGQIVASAVQGNGVVIEGNGSTGNRVQGNFIGLPPDGRSRGIGNYRYGVLIASGASANLVGGTSTGEGNYIGFNGVGGIRVDGAANAIQGNTLGLGSDDTTILGNQGNAIRVSAPDTVIGPGNIIAASGGAGILLTSQSASVSATNSQIISNTVRLNNQAGICILAAGVQMSGNRVRENGGQVGSECGATGGVIIAGASATRVVQNEVALNQGSGVVIRNGAGNLLSENSIYDNTAQGISLQQGGNRDAAAPLIQSVVPGSTAVQVTGQACARCAVEIYTDDGAQGSYFARTVFASASGSFDTTLPLTLVRGAYVTATSTDAENNTSSFAPSLAFAPDAPPPPQPAPTDDMVLLPLIMR